MRIYNSFSEMFNVSFINNSYYRDWWDNGKYLNVLGDEMDYIRTLGMAIADGEDEEFHARTRKDFVEAPYFPVNLSGIAAQVCSKALDYYEAQSLEQGKLLDVSQFVEKVHNELMDGFSTFSKYHQLSSYALDETPKEFSAVCYGLDELLRIERPRIAKLVRSKQRWGDR